MALDMREYNSVVNNLNVNIIYSGPMWIDGIKGISEMVKIHLAHENLPVSAAKAVFSVFIEQITNMLMYSAQKERDVSIGMLALGQKGDIFFVQTRNAIRTKNVGIVKERIDHLNTLDKKELRKYYKEQLNSDNENPESQGAGLGLIDIARRTTSPIEYQFEPIDDELSYFTMYAEIARDGGN